MTDAVLAAIGTLGTALGVSVRKAADGDVDAYAAQLMDFVDQALKGTMDRTDFARAHRELIREYGPAVYVASLEDCGVPEEGMTQDDDDAIEAWVSDQISYVPDFAKAVIDARGDELAADAVRGRVDAWASSARALATVACMSAKKNQMGRWKFDPDKEHCQSEGSTIGCADLNGERHRLSWFQERGYIPQEPGSETLTCHGFHCGCKIVADDGSQLLP